MTVKAEMHGIDVSADIHEYRTNAEIQLVPIHTVNYGFMGIQQYRGVETVDDDQER